MPTSSPSDSRPAGGGHVFDYLAAFISRHPYLVLLVTAAVTGLAAWRLTRLELRTDLSELLPSKDPAVVVMREMDQRMAAISSLMVVIEGPDPDANRRYVDELVPRLRDLARRTPVMDDVEWGVKREEAYYRHNKFLYPTLEELQRAHDRLQREILKRKNPLYVDLEDDAEEKASKKTAKLVNRAAMDEKEKELLGKFPGGYYALKDRRIYGVIIWLKSSVFGDRAGEEAADRIREVTRALQPARFHPAMHVGLTGNVLTSREERQALESDLAWATTICVTLCCLSIFLFYGRLRAIPFASIPPLCGMVMALGFAQLAFGYLNASTAFLGTIIVGNGINYAIIQMARYEEERRAGRAVQEAIALAVRSTWRATATASVGAAVAYGSLIITSFRGFNQFGYIGGVGMILSWLVTVTALPAMWVLFDRRSTEQTVPRIKGFAAAEPLARFIVRHPKLILAVGALLTLAALIPLPRYARDPFEYDFNNLRNQRSRTGENEVLSSKLFPLFGRSLTPGFILAERPDQVEELRRSLREKDKGYNMLGAVRTINDFLPGDPDTQRRKLEVLARIRTLIDKHKNLLDPRDRADVEAYRPPDDLRVLVPGDLPPTLRRFYTEKDGTIGRIVAYFASEDPRFTVWDGRNQIKLAAIVQQVKLPSGETVRSSGSPVIFAAMLNAITHDGPIVTLASLLGVALLVVLVIRRALGSALVLGVLVVGVLWMVGGAAAGYVRINFLNFIALPITFGINIDYAANLYLRYQLEGRGRIVPTVAATGAAVALCSLTTIIGYGALLVADNHALRSFGSLAILGEFACLAAALVLLPAMIELIDRRRARRT